MPLGYRGGISPDLLEAERFISYRTAQYCKMMAARPRRTGPPAYVVPPRNAIRWQPRGELALPAGPETATDIEVPFTGQQGQIPVGYDGVLIAVTNSWNGTGFIEGSGDITWRIKQDRRFIPFFDTILITLGSLAVPYDVVGQGIPLLSGQTLRYFANFAVGSDGRLNAGGKVLCALTGYIWPRLEYGLS